MWIDIVIVAFVALCVLVGAKRGLILSLVSALSLVIAIVAAYFFMGPVNAILQSTSLPGKISSSVTELLDKGSDAVERSADVTSREIVEGSKLPDFITDKLSKIKVGSSVTSSFDEMSGAIGKKVSAIATKALAFLIVFLIAYIVLLIIRLTWKGVRKIEFVKKVDTWGGVLFGFAGGMLIVTAVMLLICTVCATGSWQGLADTINKTVVAKFLYEKNFLGAIIASL